MILVVRVGADEDVGAAQDVILLLARAGADEQTRLLVHHADRATDLLAILVMGSTAAARRALDLGLRAIGDLAVADAGRQLEAAELARIAQRHIPEVVLAPRGGGREAGDLRRLVLDHVLTAIAVAGLVARVAEQVTVAAGREAAVDRGA